MAEVVAIAMWDDKYVGILFGLFAALALCLAAVGIYGVVSYSVAQRTHEIGVRMALGAQTGDVMRMIIRQGLRPVWRGLALGILAALLSGRLVAGLLFGVTPSDPATILAVTGVMLASAALACWIPARRVVQTSLLSVLRYE